MGFDLMLVDAQDAGGLVAEVEPTDGEAVRLFDVGGFFALAESLTATLGILRDNGVPLDLGEDDMVSLVESWEEYLDHPDRLAFERRFDEYCEFVRGAFAEAQRNAGGFAQVLAGDGLATVSAEEFDPDVRAALGRALLPTEPHDPTEAAALVNLVFFAGGLLGRMSAHLRSNDQTDAADQFQSVAMGLKPLVDFASRAAEEGRFLVVDF